MRCLVLTRCSVRAVQLSEIMTAGVVTSAPDAERRVSVARLMRDHRVGSVVIVDQGDSPVAMVTDRDLAVRAFAEGVDAGLARSASTPRGRWSAASRRWSSTRRRR